MARGRGPCSVQPRFAPLSLVDEVALALRATGRIARCIPDGGDCVVAAGACRAGSMRMPPTSFKRSSRPVVGHGRPGQTETDSVGARRATCGIGHFMTERLADIAAHVRGVEQLGSVVGAMRAIAAARAQQSRDLLPGIRAYAGVIAQAIAQALRLLPEDHCDHRTTCDPVGIGPDPVHCGARLRWRVFRSHAGGGQAAICPMPRCSSLARGAPCWRTNRRLRIAWRTGMALHSDGAAGVAARICEALYERLPGAQITRVDLVFPTWVPGVGLLPQTRSLMPLDRQVFANVPIADAPLTTLPPAVSAGASGRGICLCAAL